MSADVLEDPNTVQKREDAVVEFKKDSKLKHFLFLKSGNKEKSFTFIQVPLLLFSQQKLLSISILDYENLKRCGNN